MGENAASYLGLKSFADPATNRSRLDAKYASEWKCAPLWREKVDRMS
jgi:hypothetical protein